MKGISKRFQNVVANDKVDFSVKAGEIHALLGENGAGKTTLMNILYGLYQADEGEIVVHGEKVLIRSPRHAIKIGIGMVHQHFKLVDSNTVAENIALCLQPDATKAPVNLLKILQNPLPSVEAKIKDLSQKYGLQVDPKAKIWQLSVGEQQKVEIIKALFRGVDVLILDEPTSVLTPAESDQLFQTLRTMTNEGHAVVFITHKLEEVERISHRVTVLRDGKVVASLETSQTDKRNLAKLMVGREIFFRLEKAQVARGDPVLEVKGIKALNDQGVLALKGVSLTVHSSEILGIVGVAGNGQKELAEVITGLRTSVDGEIKILGKNVTNHSANTITRLGTAYIPEERIRVGVVQSMSVSDNMVLKAYRSRSFANGFWLKTKRIEEFSKELASEYNIVTPNLQAPVKLLSGGNIQRLILAREIWGNPKLIVASHPTYGLDVGATEQIRRLLLAQKKNGTAVLLISEDLEEVLSLSDRIMVMFNGAFLCDMPSEGANVDEIGLMMAGIKS